MLDMQARLARQAISIAVVKAMEDMGRNARRSIRNLIDLGLMFSQGENQRWFFETAKRVIGAPRNPYNQLVARAVRLIDNETLRKVGLNLGYNALSYGAKRIRKKQEALGVEIPWLLAVDAPAGDELLPRLDACVAEGQEMGIYSYALRARDAEALPHLVEAARRHDDSFFVLRLGEALVDRRAAELAAQAHNLLVAVELEGASAAGEAFRRLRDNRCLYGFALTYAEEDVARVTSPEFLRGGIESGCLFGAYLAADGASQAARDRVHEFACRERGESGQPLIVLDWPRDILEIGEKLRVGAWFPVDLAGKAYFACREATSQLGALAELFRRAQVCPA